MTRGEIRVHVRRSLRVQWAAGAAAAAETSPRDALTLYAVAAASGRTSGGQLAQLAGTTRRTAERSADGLVDRNLLDRVEEVRRTGVRVVSYDLPVDVLSHVAARLLELAPEGERERLEERLDRLNGDGSCE